MPLICDGDFCEYVPSEREMKTYYSDDEHDDDPDDEKERNSKDISEIDVDHKDGVIVNAEQSCRRTTSLTNNIDKNISKHDNQTKQKKKKKNRKKKKKKLAVGSNDHGELSDSAAAAFRSTPCHDEQEQQQEQHHSKDDETDNVKQTSTTPSTTTVDEPHHQQQCDNEITITKHSDDESIAKINTQTTKYEKAQHQPDGTTTSASDDTTSTPTHKDESNNTTHDNDQNQERVGGTTTKCDTTRDDANFENEEGAVSKEKGGAVVIPDETKSGAVVLPDKEENDSAEVKSDQDTNSCVVGGVLLPDEEKDSAVAVLLENNKGEGAAVSLQQNKDNILKTVNGQVVNGVAVAVSNKASTDDKDDENELYFFTSSEEEEEEEDNGDDEDFFSTSSEDSDNEKDDSDLDSDSEDSDSEDSDSDSNDEENDESTTIEQQQQIRRSSIITALTLRTNDDCDASSTFFKNKKGAATKLRPSRQHDQRQRHRQSRRIVEDNTTVTTTVDGFHDCFYDIQDAGSAIHWDEGLEDTGGLCFPSNRNKDAGGHGGGGGASSSFILYNPYIISYIICLSKKNPPERSSKILDILHRLIQAATMEPTKYISTIVFHGGIGAVLSTMKTHLKNNKIQERSCHLLGLLTQDNVEHQQKLALHFGMTQILICMTNSLPTIMSTIRSSSKSSSSSSSSAASLHKEAMWLLSCVLGYDDNAHQFTMNRGVNVVLKSLKTYPKNQHIQLHGTTVLRLLSVSHVGCIDTPQVVQVIVSAMKQYSKRSNAIQVNGCAVLYALAKEGTNTDTQDVLVDSKLNIVSLVLACMKDNLHIPIVICQCCSTLRYLAQGRSEARDAMVRDGAVSIIWSLLKLHLTNVIVQREGSKALKCLSKGPQSKSTVTTNTTTGSDGEAAAGAGGEDVPDCINLECDY